MDNPKQPRRTAVIGMYVVVETVVLEIVVLLDVVLEVRVDAVLDVSVSDIDVVV